MSRYIIFALVFLLALSFVSAVPDFTVSAPSSILVPENSQRETSFTVTNNGDANLTNILFSHNVKLSDGTHSITLTFDPSSIAALNTGASQTVRAIASAPDNMKLGTYSGVVNLTSGSIQKSINLEIIVSPEICSDGPVGGDLSLSIESPDSGDSFKPGKDLEVSIEVDNKGSEDKNIIVKAYLYNMEKGKQIVSVESAKKKITEDDTSTFDLTLKIPTDNKYIKPDIKYLLFVKAFESGDEDTNCKEVYTNLELELEDEEAVIESVTFSPTSASCGDSITAAVKVRNIGLDSLDDVRVELINSELKINKVSSFFDLSEYENEDDNNYLAQLTFSIPEDAQDKEYDFSDIKAVYSGGSSSFNLETIPKLVVSGCKKTEENLIASGSEASLSVNPTQTSVAVGSSLIMNYALTNPTTSDASYTIDFVPNGNWAGSVSQTISVKAGQTYTGALSTLTNNVAQAAYTGILYVKSGSSTLAQKQISIDLLNPNQITGGAAYVEKSLLDDLKIGNIPIAFWIIADLILAFIILALVYIVYRR